MLVYGKNEPELNSLRSAMRAGLDLQATLQTNKPNMAYNEQTWQHCIQKKTMPTWLIRLDLATNFAEK